MVCGSAIGVEVDAAPSFVHDLIADYMETSGGSGEDDSSSMQVESQAKVGGAFACARERPDNVPQKPSSIEAVQKTHPLARFARSAYERHFSNCPKVAHAEYECRICQCERRKKQSHGCVYVATDSETPRQIARQLKLNPEHLLALNRNRDRFKGLSLNSKLEDKTVVLLVEWEMACVPCALAIEVCFKCGSSTNPAEPIPDVVYTGLMTGGSRYCADCAPPPPNYSTFCTARSRNCQGPNEQSKAKPHPFVPGAAVCGDCFDFLTDGDWTQEEGKEQFCRW
jgi:hypothetical protein